MLSTRTFKSLAIAVILLFTAVLSFSDFSTAQGTRRFLAGAASSDITPDIEKWEVPMNGYGARKKAPATGIHDRLSSKAIALTSIDTGGARRDAVFVSVDLCMVTESLRKAVLERISELGYDDDNFFFAATHTHSGTASIDTRWPVKIVMGKFNRELFEFTADRIAESVFRANENLEPAKIGITQADFPSLVRNRRKDKYDYATRKFAGERSDDIDAQMSVVKILHQDGKPFAMIVVLASHPTIIGPESMLISADWPGSLRKTLEARMGEGSVALFANGAEGDQAPDSIESADDYEWADKYGRAVADAAWKLADKIEPTGDIAMSAAVARVSLPRMRLKPAGGMILPKIFTKKVANEAIGAALILGDAAFLGLPGEPLHKVGLLLKEKALELGVQKPIVVGVANDWIGYISDPASYEEGGYEASMTLFGSKEYEYCLEAAINALSAAQDM